MKNTHNTLTGIAITALTFRHGWWCLTALGGVFAKQKLPRTIAIFILLLFAACDLLDDKNLLSLELQGTWEWCFNGQNDYNTSSPTADPSKGKMVITLDQITFSGDLPRYEKGGYPDDILAGVYYSFYSTTSGTSAPGAQAITYIKIEEDGEYKPYFNYIIRRRDDGAVILTVLKNPNGTGGGWGDSRDYPNYVKQR